MPSGTNGLRKLTGRGPVETAVNKLIDAVTGLELQPGPGCRVNRSSSGQRIIVTRGSSRPNLKIPETDPHPFQIRSIPRSGTWPLIYVNLASYVSHDAGETNIPITGLGDTELFEVPGLGGIIYLKISFDAGLNPTGAWIEYGTKAAWNNWPHPIERDEETGRQIYLYVSIAEVNVAEDVRPGIVVTNGQESLKVVQCLTTNLRLHLVALFGRPAVMAFGAGIPPYT